MNSKLSRCHAAGRRRVVEWSGVETDLKVKMRKIRHGREVYHWDFGEMRWKPVKVVEKAVMQNLDSQLLGLPAVGLKQFGLHQNCHCFARRCYSTCGEPTWINRERSLRCLTVLTTTYYNILQLYFRNLLPPKEPWKRLATCQKKCIEMFSGTVHGLDLVSQTFLLQLTTLLWDGK